MSRKRHPLNIITRASKRLIRRFLSTTKKQIIWLLRTVFSGQEQQQSANAGFVLPTVVMVSVVVVLLTTAIMFRAFDRAKNASNVRINEAVLSNATPAIDRGRAKINKLFQEPTLPRGTPTDTALYSLLVNKLDAYTLGDETQLQIGVDIAPISISSSNGTITTVAKNGTIDLPNSSTAIYNNETVNTAWMYPVDTDNNGKFDSYTLYAILFRTPYVSNGQNQRARNALEARTPPMSAGNLSANCGASTSASLVGSSGWTAQGSVIKKSFFVYTATVPITTAAGIPNNSTGVADTTNYEIYQGNKGFAAVEYQQDRTQTIPNNTAVVYNDDISLTPGAAFNLNGSVFTNSNLLTSNVNSGAVRFYQVSSQSSCYYDARNAKITVGGNVARGGMTNTSQTGSATVDLYQGAGNAVTSGSWINSTTNAPNVTAYNNLAYANRINNLVNAQMTASPTGSNYPTGTTDPITVQVGVATTLTNLGLTTATTTSSALNNYRSQQLTSYFQTVTRRVPYTEVAFGITETPPTTILQGSGNTLRPIDAWSYPTSPTDGKTGTGYTGLTLNISGTSLKPTATLPTKVTSDSGKESNVGDRVLVGNNLPAMLWDSTNQVISTQTISGVNWDLPTSPTTPRTRQSLVQTLASVGSTDRDGDWEVYASQVPSNLVTGVGGLRVITGSGIYLPNPSYPSPSSLSTILASLPIPSLSTSTSPPSFTTTIWPDTYPVPQAPSKTTYTQTGSNFVFKWRTLADTNAATTTPYLQMRATAVYHYAVANYNATTPKPIACISSFYVPTNSTTAKNLPSLPWDAGSASATTVGSVPYYPLSNNGIVYPAPTLSGYSSTASTASNYTTILNNNVVTNVTYLDVLKYQSTLKYRNGRYVDGGILARALNKVTNTLTLTLSEQSAIDAQICALQILNGISPITTTASPTTATPIIEHGTIREISFLDAREVYQNSISGTSQTYDMPVKDRQPIEIRATVLNLDLLRKKPISGASPAEYLLPNSGIIYVARNGALPDSSAYTSPDTNYPYPFADALPGDSIPVAQAKTNSQSVSPVDYILDPSRRPDGVMLINGSNLARSTTYNTQEKGLIVATSLPAYILGNFNLHQDSTGTIHQEFTQKLLSASDWSNNFYTRSTFDYNFACRQNDSRLPYCTLGDTWRPATIIADAATLLSSTFTFGFRSHSDFDWNYNYQDQNSSSPYPPNNSCPVPGNALGSPCSQTNNTSYSTVNNFVSSGATKSTGSYYSNGVIPTGINSYQATQPQPATSATTFNAIFATGDSPGRSTATVNEDNGGLHNFVRFLESWSGNTVSISGAFMQVKKSAYATGSFATSLSNTSNLLYPGAGNTVGNISGSNIVGTPWYSAPTRLWGYDVALLSQSPDLFASKLVLTPNSLPNEYYREVSRDDPWVTTLLCAKSCANGACPISATTTSPTSPINSTPFAIVDSSQRPSCTPYAS
ncbi:MAG: hormogonium polysaccharide biosynthesis protein HpsA [Aphanizomenon gracile PMC649.10]|nr:hormogonium polysaccharide biosynthesis protein HpsA [Aphanizomenon gracile PMC649.10]